MLAAPPASVCMGVAESAAADWPQVLRVICHLTRSHGWLARCCAAGLVGWVCASLVRTERKSLARVLTPSALDLSLSVSLAMHAAKVLRVRVL